MGQGPAEAGCQHWRLGDPELHKDPVTSVRVDRCVGSDGQVLSGSHCHSVLTLLVSGGAAGAQ